MSPAIGQLQKRLSYTYDKQYYVPRITVISLEIVHEGLRRHVEDALLLPLFAARSVRCQKVYLANRELLTARAR